MVAIALLVASCDDLDGSGPWSCPTFAQPTASGIVDSDLITEASGLVFSRKNPGVLWTHNDSGDEARLLALDTTGVHLGTYDLPGASSWDYEDIAAGPGPEPGVDYLYVGDIGDNTSARETITIYRFVEPQVEPGQQPVSESVGDVEALVMSYPDGAHDAETLLVDPHSGDIYIVTNVASGASQVFVSEAPQDTTGTRDLSQMATLTFGQGDLAGTDSPLATAGDISADGSEVLIKTYDDVFLWPWDSGATLAHALAGEPCTAPLASEPQGESIAFDPSGQGYYTLSEGEHQPLYFYARVR